MAPDTHERLKRFWDEDSATYDHTASHSVADPVEAAAWRAAIARHLPPAPATVLDMGAGTGAMTLLAAELGYRVTALDLSEGMLEKLRAKAATRRLDVEIVVGPADAPPPGPFDAIMSRHLVWTLPDPVKTLAAWRSVAGRLALFEGEWGGDAPVDRVRSTAAKLVRRALDMGHEHHRRYEPELLEALPFGRGTDAGGLVRVVEDAGWRGVRIERLRDVEWARDRLRHAALRPLEAVPQFAIVASA